MMCLLIACVVCQGGSFLIFSIVCFVSGFAVIRLWWTNTKGGSYRMSVRRQMVEISGL